MTPSDGTCTNQLPWSPRGIADAMLSIPSCRVDSEDYRYLSYRQPLNLFKASSTSSGCIARQKDVMLYSSAPHNPPGGGSPTFHYRYQVANCIDLPLGFVRPSVDRPLPTDNRSMGSTSPCKESALLQGV